MSSGPLQLLRGITAQTDVAALGQALSAFQARAELEGRKVPFSLTVGDGAPMRFGTGEPVFDIRTTGEEGVRALRSFDALTIAQAYMDGLLDIQGNLIDALAYQESLADLQPWIYVWRRLEPLLRGRERTNPDWISLHYDADNAHLFAMDTEYNTYTPGIYEDAADSLEKGAERKLSAAFASLQLAQGQTLLDIGCGWGGMLRFAARRGVTVTGITLSRRQKEFTDALIDREKLPARVLYQDFFTYQPTRLYDAISMMGVIEDLSDYRRVMQSLARWVKPGGRVYLDFGAERKRFATHSFITKYIWPGTFRMVFMPEFVEAVRESPFELHAVENDRRNYHLWCRGMYERWMQQHEAIVAQHGERLWRTFRILFAGVAATMDRPSHSATAYRVVLELPADHDGSFWTSPSIAAQDRVRACARAGREALMGLWEGRLGPR